MQKRHLTEFENVKSCHQQEIECLQAKISDNAIASANISRMISETSQIEDMTGNLSQDIQRITYLKAQENENIELKQRIKKIDEKFREVVGGFHSKVSKKNKRIRELEEELKVMKKSFHSIKTSMREMNTRTSRLEQVCMSNGPQCQPFEEASLNNKYSTQMSSDDFVLFKTRERYSTPSKLQSDQAHQTAGSESVIHTRCTPLDNSNLLSPNRFTNSESKNQ